MSQDTSGTPASHAHSVAPVTAGKLAEASNTVQQQFAKAAELRQEQQIQPQNAERTGSDMVREAGPKLNLNPPQPMRQEVDRQAHQAALARDTARAQHINAQAKARQGQQKQAELKSERHQDYGRER